MKMTTVAARRRLLLDMARRRAQPGTGSCRAFLEARTAMTRWPDLTPTLTGIRWTVVGAVATRAYMPERTTQDLEILVNISDQEEVRASLQGAGFLPVQALAIGGMTWRSPAGDLVDVIESRATWASEALQSLRQDRQGLPVLDLPYLILMKVEAGRAQDLADAARMLGSASEARCEETREIFRRYLPDAQDDLESLIALGRLEMGT
jgi:hypothetical protein